MFPAAFRYSLLLVDVYISTLPVELQVYFLHFVPHFMQLTFFHLCFFLYKCTAGKHTAPAASTRKTISAYIFTYPAACEKNVPHRASDDCKQQKFRHLHPCHPGGDGNEASDDGNAPAEQNGPLAFLLKPCNRFPGILRVKSEKLHRAAVEQYLRILPFESVYAQLGRTAVAAVGFDAQSRLEIHRLGQIARGGRFEEFGRGHRYDSR